MEIRPKTASLTPNNESDQMKVKIDESLEFVFDSWSIENAEKAIAKIKANHGDRADNVLSAVSTLLLFAQVEKQSPGKLDKLTRSATAISKHLKPPTVE